MRRAPFTLTGPKARWRTTRRISGRLVLEVEQDAAVGAGTGEPTQPAAPALATAL